MLVVVVTIMQTFITILNKISFFLIFQQKSVVLRTILPTEWKRFDNNCDVGHLEAHCYILISSVCLFIPSEVQRVAQWVQRRQCTAQRHPVRRRSRRSRHTRLRPRHHNYQVRLWLIELNLNFLMCVKTIFKSTRITKKAFKSESKIHYQNFNKRFRPYTYSRCVKYWLKYFRYIDEYYKDSGSLSKL